LCMQITCNKPAGWTGTRFHTLTFLSEASYEAQQMLRFKLWDPNNLV
jgi:hypothetical protein